MIGVILHLFIRFHYFQFIFIFITSPNNNVYNTLFMLKREENGVWKNCLISGDFALRHW